MLTKRKRKKIQVNTTRNEQENIANTKEIQNFLRNTIKNHYYPGKLKRHEQIYRFNKTTNIKPMKSQQPKTVP